MAHRYMGSRGTRFPDTLTPPTCGAVLAPGHRIGVFVVILLVIVVRVGSGHSVDDALGIVMAAGAAAVQIVSWLSMQRLTAASAGVA
ncbi:hypothetical protein ACFXDH_51740 [Streptomyces sp. NPDC059467]|uniref:hypothetical protein n=1 Tax=Streptomyces sp. NPDC059467 TaxID=3346844 RepID=UPI0036C84AB6